MHNFFGLQVRILITHEYMIEHGTFAASRISPLTGLENEPTSDAIRFMFSPHRDDLERMQLGGSKVWNMKNGKEHVTYSRSPFCES